MAKEETFTEAVAQMPPPIARYLLEAIAQHNKHDENLDRSLTEGERVLVAYFDVLGFRARTRNLEDARALYKAYRLAFGAAAQSTYHAQSRKEEDQWRHPFDKLLRPSVFSDSVFIVTSDTSGEASQQLQQVVNEMTGIFLLQGLPVTGAIGVGEVWWDARAGIRLGPGITNTYLLAESLDVVGIGVADDLPGPSGSKYSFPRKNDADEQPRKPLNLRVPVRSFAPTQYDWAAIPIEAMAKFEELESTAPSTVQHKYRSGRDICFSILAGGHTAL